MQASHLYAPIYIYTYIYSVVGREVYLPALQWISRQNKTLKE